MRGILASPLPKLYTFLVLGKAAVVIYAVLATRSPDTIQLMAVKWDAGIYQTIATQGYQSPSSYVFSPIYPALIKLAYMVIGSTWVSAYLVTNILSFIFPFLLYRAYGYGTAFFATMFPTYLLFGTIPYSDVIALIFLAACFLLLARDRVSWASAAASDAILTFFNLVWVLPSFLIPLFANRNWKNILFYTLPILTGGVIVLWLKIETGSYFDFVKLEAPWGVQFANPIKQAYYLLCSNPPNSFTCQPWEADGVFLPPAYWLLRNIAFEAFYIFGAFYLLKTTVKYRVFFCAYCLSVTIPLMFWTGFVALSIPRLLLPAFPVFIGYSSLFKKHEIPYAAVCIALAAAFSIMQYLAYFS